MSALPHRACATCTHFRAKAEQSPDGWCAKYRTETWGAYADGCADGWKPADQALVAVAHRRHAVSKQLEADPALRYAFDVAGATPGGPAQTDVSVVLSLRTADGAIVAGELRVPADRWPGVGAFAAYWQQAGEVPPSPVSA